MIRCLALAIVVALMGPALAGLACAWTCVAAHQATEHQTADTAGACHGHEPAREGRALAAAEPCHEIAVGAVALGPAPAQTSVVATTPALLDVDPVVVNRPRPAMAPSASGAPPGPPLRHLPLRI